MNLIHVFCILIIKGLHIGIVLIYAKNRANQYKSPSVMALGTYC